MVHPFRVQPESIGALSPYDAVEQVAGLVRADAAVSGMSGTEIDIPGNMAAADGGVDGIARDAPRQSLHGLVKKGTTAYLIRSGRFAPGKVIADMLFTRAGAVKERIRSCLEQGGTLVVLLTGWDGADRTDGEMAGRFRQALASRSEAFAQAGIDVWGRSRIAAAMERFPVLALGMGDKAGVRLCEHGEWASLSDMSYTFMSGGAEGEFIDKLRDGLRRGDGSGPVHIRVSGEAGSGKTRLVLEATRAADLAPRIVYAEDPAAAEPFLRDILSGTVGGRWATGAAPILVVDECDPDSRASIWNSLMRNPAGVHLVTIYVEPDGFARGAEQLTVGNMADEQIEAILRGHASIMDGAIGGWVDYARPSPRAAHIVGENLSSNPLNIFAPPSNVRVWERWIAGGSGRDRRYGGKEYEERYTVLLWLSLFTRFGFGAPHESDAAAIAGMIRSRHPDIQEWRFREIVGVLRDTKVLQGHSILYITPRLLHDYLWLRWWDRYGEEDAPSAVDLAEDDEGGGSAIAARSRRYCDMFARMRDRPEARAVAERLLGPGGLFDGREDLRRSLGSGLFAALCSASPEAALACLERTIGHMQAREVAGLDDRVRAEAVEAAARMTERRETFARAARLLLRLAQADDSGADASTWRGAPGAFCRAFDPAPSAGYGDVPLGERLEMLAEAACAPGDGYGGGGARARTTAIHACGEVLRMRRNSLAVPYQCGFGRPPDAWRPDEGERAAAVEYLRGVLDLLGRIAGDRARAGPERRAAARALVESLTQTVLVPEIAGRALDEAGRLQDAGLADREEVLAAAAHMADHEAVRLDAGVLARLRSMVDGAAASADFHTRLARRTGRPRHPDTDKDSAELARLAEEAASNPAVLMPELDHLVSGSAADADRFGLELARRDRALLLAGPILSATRKAAAGGGDATASLLGGYLAEVRRNGPADADRIMDRVCADNVLIGLVPELALVSGALPERPAAAVAEAAAEGRMDAASLELLGLGCPISRIPRAIFDALARAVIDMAGREGDGRGPRPGSGGLNAPAPAPVVLATTALNMLHRYYMRDEAGYPSSDGPVPERLALDVLLHPAILGCRAGDGRGVVDANKWAETALAAARCGRDAALAIAEAVIDGLGDRGGLLDRRGHMSGTFQAALDEIARMHPRDVWEMAASRIGPPIPQGPAAYDVMAWLRGGYKMPRNWLGAHTSYVAVGDMEARGGTSAIPPQIILEWAGRDGGSGARAEHVAPLMPPRLDAVRGLLSRFGHIEGVRRGVSASFDRRPGEHPAGAYYRRILGELKAWRAEESDPNVAAWLEEYASTVAGRAGRELEYEMGWLRGGAAEAEAAAGAAAAR